MIEYGKHLCKKMSVTLVHINKTAVIGKYSDRNYNFLLQKIVQDVNASLKGISN